METRHTDPMLPNADRAIIGSLLQSLLRHSSAELILFGSRARGDARPTSDIDIALRAPHPIPPHLLAIARQLLDESIVPFNVDLLDYAALSPEMQQVIDREGIPWPE
jgi:uncharacterized protein